MHPYFLTLHPRTSKECFSHIECATDPVSHTLWKFIFSGLVESITLAQVSWGPLIHIESIFSGYLVPNLLFWRNIAPIHSFASLYYEKNCWSIVRLLHLRFSFHLILMSTPIVDLLLHNFCRLSSLTSISYFMAATCHASLCPCSITSAAIRSLIVSLRSHASTDSFSHP